ncbi:MAG TPA: YihY/virulence factor BrkB family protein, partial [Coriobacteriia bacterium]|nr:YihY/virulence factor BrkB family protein [Coriobacteriia bacterium]
MKTALALLSQTYDEWRLDGAPQIAAALTYYVFLSLAPMLVLTVSLVGRYLGRSTVTGRVLEQAQALAGPAGAGIVRELVSAAQPSALGTLASVVALVVALFGSMRLFAQLRIAFDRMWNIPRADPPDGDFWTSVKWGLSSFGKDNLASFLMVIGVGGLLVISLALSTALTVAAGQIAPLLRI